MTVRERSVFPGDLAEELARLGDRLDRDRVDDSSLEALLQRLDAMPAAAVARSDLEIRLRCRLYRTPALVLPRGRLWLPQSSPREPGLLKKHPALALMFMFHGDGRIRELALRRLDQGLRSPFFFAALAWRLNDWAEPVRAAAADAAKRLFPQTPAEVVASAALSLVGVIDSWRRWDEAEALFHDALDRPDVAALLAGACLSARSGPIPKALRHALRRKAMDAYLPALAAQAAIPGVRATAYQALIDRRATWPTGFRKQWVDRSMGHFRRVRVFGEREVGHGLRIADLVLAAAMDRATAVRRVAADALVRSHTDLANAEEVLGLLLADESRSVRSRAEFVAGQRGA